jgi:uncharacterized membrane protein YccC
MGQDKLKVRGVCCLKKNKIKETSILHNLPILIKQAFKIKKSQLPWTKAITAGLCSGIPVFIGLLLGNFQYGLIAGIGSFTYLYVFHIPYAQRAKKLFFVLIGLSLSVGLGTLVAPFPFVAAITVGLIGAIATFIFGSLKVTGPAAIFFVLGFAMSSGMTVDPSLAPLRAGLVFSGGVLSFFAGMLGFVQEPHGPEMIAVKKSYQSLANYIDSVGTDFLDEARLNLVSALKSADAILLAGYVSWRNPDPYKRLLLLQEHAHFLFLSILEHVEEKNAKLAPELAASIHTIAHAIGNKYKSNEWIIGPVEHYNEDEQRILTQILAAISIMNEPLTTVTQEIQLSKPSAKAVFRSTFNKDSIVLFTAIRFGIILTLASVIAYSFDFNRSYWITLSCAAVMSGSTILSTFHRAIQRSIGTVVGILIASLILSFQPDGFIIVIATVILTALTELAIVLNYGIAAFFITPNALLIAERASPLQPASFLTSARMIDVLIGCSIGLIGILLISRKKASRSLPALLAATIRSERQFILMLFSEQKTDADSKHFLEAGSMQTKLTNLSLVYKTAHEEIPAKAGLLDSLRSAIFSVEYLGYLLKSCQRYPHRPILSTEDLVQMKKRFEAMEIAAEQHRPLVKGPIPELKGFSKLHKEINHLQDALQSIH